jgi:hypothetical protein
MSTIEQLQARVTEIDASIAALDSEFSDLAGAFDTGNERALQKAEAIEQRINSLRREKAVCLAAAGQVEKRRLQEQSEAQQAEKRKLQIQAKQHADACASLNVEVDRKFVELATLLTQRHDVLRALCNTGIVPDALIGRMQSKGSITAAACAAALHRHIDIHAVANASVRPLADGNRILLNVGIAPEPSPEKRERRALRNGG